MSGSELDSSTGVTGLGPLFLLLVGLLSAPPCGLTTYPAGHIHSIEDWGVVVFLAW